jgi:hypothetical protein
MKPTLATSLSLVAVLAAGTLAAAANLRVFSDPAHPPAAGAIGAAQPGPDEDGGSAGAGTGAASGGVQTFSLGPAGSLTLDTTGGLHVVRVDPSPGWVAERLSGSDGAVVVAFRSASGTTRVVTATPGRDGVRVVAHDGLATLGLPTADHDADADDD